MSHPCGAARRRCRIGRATHEPALFEEAIREGGHCLDASLAGFAAGFAGAREEETLPRRNRRLPPKPELPASLLEELEERACGDAKPLILAGLERTADYQDADYAALYWQRLLPFVTLAGSRGSDECELLAVAARQLALAMTYADAIRVAELKLRASRFARLRAQFGAGDRDILEIAEFMHPRVEEVVDTMPTGLGRRCSTASSAGPCCAG